MIIGIDHGYYAIKSRNFSFPAGVTAYTHEPYTLKNTLQIGGKYFVCGTGRQPIDLSGSAIGYHLIEFITMGQGSTTDTLVRIDFYESPVGVMYDEILVILFLKLIRRCLLHIAS